MNQMPELYRLTYASDELGCATAFTAAPSVGG
jgi:hypothetical protein